MKTLKWTVLLAGAMALGGVSPAFSHHSHAMFDHDKFLTITGTVMTFAYVNPHGELDVAVEGKNGQLVKYWFEMSNLTQMVSRGIRMTSFKPGDKVLNRAFEVLRLLLNATCIRVPVANPCV